MLSICLKSFVVHSSSLLCVICLLCLTGCGDSSDPESTGSEARSKRLEVVTSNYPLFYFTMQMTKGMDQAFDVTLPDFPDDPAQWQPQKEDIVLLQSADLVVTNGAGYENWLNWVSVPSANVLNTAEQLGHRLIEQSETIKHQHGPGGDHSHSVVAFTTWLDPVLAASQADAITAELVSRSAEHQDRLRQNLTDLQVRFKTLDEDLADVLSGLEEPVLFSHPVYQYLEARYALNAVSLHWEPREQPDTAQWIELQQILKTHPARLLIWEDTPTRETVERLAEFGIRSVVFRTAARETGPGDYFEVMKENVAEISAALADF